MNEVITYQVLALLVNNFLFQVKRLITSWNRCVPYTATMSSLSTIGGTGILQLKP